MKSRKIRSVCIALSIMFVTGIFAGCTGKSTGVDKASGSAASGETPKPVKMETIKVWTNSGHTKELVTKLVEEFNNNEGKKKGIQIEYTVNGGEYQKTCEIALAAGQAPEIMYAMGQKNDYVKRGDVVAIEDMPGGSNFLKNYEGLLDSPTFRIDGKTYAVPYNITNIKLLYNKDMFKKAGIVDEKGEAKPPKTWAEVREYAKKLTNPSEKVYGIALPLKWSAYFSWELINPFISSIGHGFFDNKTGKYNFSDFKPALEWLMGIAGDKSYFPGAEGLDNDPARAQFAEGRIGMKLGANWDIGVLNDQFPAKINWGAADVPVLDPAKRYKEYSTVSDWASITKTAKSSNQEKVMEVYKWFHSDAFLAAMYEDGKFIPYKADIVKLAKKQPDKKGWTDFSKIEKTFLAIPNPTVKIEGDAFPQTMLKIWSGITTIDQGLADLDKRYNEALDKAVKDGAIDIKPFVNEKFDLGLK